MLGYGMYCLERGQHAIGAIELAASRLAINVRTHEQWREVRLAAFERQKQVCDSVDGRLEANTLCPCHQRCPCLDLFLGQSQPAHATLGRGSKLRKIHQALPKAIPVNAVGDANEHNHHLIPTRLDGAVAKLAPKLWSCAAGSAGNMVHARNKVKNPKMPS